VTRRIYNRIDVGLEAELFSFSSTHTAFIENISEYGLYAKVARDRNVVSDNQHSCINLKLQLQSGNFFNLKCNRIWSCKNTAHSLIERMGFQIIDPPDEYIDFYHKLSAGKLYRITVD
jgi:hypothetical protein